MSMDKYEAAKAMKELGLRQRNEAIATSDNVLDLRNVLRRKAYERTMSKNYRGPTGPKGAA